jgi:hypothetical protein
MSPFRRSTPIARACAALLAAVLVAGIPGLAQARRPASSREKAAIITAMRKAGQLGPSQTSSCLQVYVSTVDSSWATLGFIYVKRCEQQDANGIAIFHKTRGAWKFITAGSDFTCPLPGHIPARVFHDLKLFCR